jgi:membrane protein required for colicin V production
VLLCVVITFFAVAALPQPQGEAIVASRSGRYIVALLDKSHSVFPPEIHQVVDPYLEKIERRLNPNFQSHAGMQTNWPTTPPAQSGQQTPAWPPMNIPQAIQQQLPQIPWPPAGGQQAPPAQGNPYAVPREPNPFPYSAEAPNGRDY